MVFRTALLIVTLAAGWVMLCIVLGQASARRWTALKLFAAVLLANVFLPHVPAALLLHGYAPGVATAVLINVPLSIIVLRSSARRGRAPGLLERRSTSTLCVGGIDTMP